MKANVLNYEQMSALKQAGIPANKETTFSWMVRIHGPIKDEPKLMFTGAIDLISGKKEVLPAYGIDELLDILHGLDNETLLKEDMLNALYEKLKNNKQGH